MLLILSFCVLYVMRCTFCARCRRCPLPLGHSPLGHSPLGHSPLRHSQWPAGEYCAPRRARGGSVAKPGQARQCVATLFRSYFEGIPALRPHSDSQSGTVEYGAGSALLARRWPLWQRPCYTRALGGRLNSYRGTCRRCRSGEMGRHVGFKIRCGKTRAGSSPASGTISGKIMLAPAIAHSKTVNKPLTGPS